MARTNRRNSGRSGKNPGEHHPKQKKKASKEEGMRIAEENERRHQEKLKKRAERERAEKEARERAGMETLSGGAADDAEDTDPEPVEASRMKNQKLPENNYDKLDQGITARQAKIKTEGAHENFDESSAENDISKEQPRRIQLKTELSERSEEKQGNSHAQKEDRKRAHEEEQREAKERNSENKRASKEDVTEVQGRKKESKKSRKRKSEDEMSDQQVDGHGSGPDGAAENNDGIAGEPRNDHTHGGYSWDDDFTPLTAGDQDNTEVYDKSEPRLKLRATSSRQSEDAKYNDKKLSKAEKKQHVQEEQWAEKSKGLIQQSPKITAQNVLDFADGALATGIDLNSQETSYDNSKKSKNKKRRWHDVVVPPRLVCYNCGSVGHLSEACPAERMCLNCKGRNHEWKQCLHPKQCHVCLAVEHISEDCPIMHGQYRREYMKGVGNDEFLYTEGTRPNKKTKIEKSSQDPPVHTESVPLHHAAENATDTNISQDVPRWLRNMGFQKYTNNFKDLEWAELLELDRDAMHQRGIHKSDRKDLLELLKQIKDSERSFSSLEQSASQAIEAEETTESILEKRQESGPSASGTTPNAKKKEVSRSPTTQAPAVPRERSAKEEALLASIRRGSKSPSVIKIPAAFVTVNSQATDDSYEEYARTVNITPTNFIRKSALANSHKESPISSRKKTVQFQDEHEESIQAHGTVAELEPSTPEAQDSEDDDSASDATISRASLAIKSKQVKIALTNAKRQIPTEISRKASPEASSEDSDDNASDADIQGVPEGVPMNTNKPSRNGDKATKRTEISAQDEANSSTPEESKGEDSEYEHSDSDTQMQDAQVIPPAPNSTPSQPQHFSPPTLTRKETPILPPKRGTPQVVIRPPTPSIKTTTSKLVLKGLSMDGTPSKPIEAKKSTAILPPGYSSSRTNDIVQPRRASVTKSTNDVGRTDETDDEDEREVERKVKVISDDWEMGPGHLQGNIAADGTDVQENIAFSSQYVTSQPCGIRVANAHFQVLKLSPALPWQVLSGLQDGQFLLCSVAEGRVKVKLGREFQRMFVISKGGVWRIRGGEECEVRNETADGKAKEDAVVHLVHIA